MSKPFKSINHDIACRVSEYKPHQLSMAVINQIFDAAVYRHVSSITALEKIELLKEAPEIFDRKILNQSGANKVGDVVDAALLSLIGEKLTPLREQLALKLHDGHVVSTLKDCVDTVERASNHVPDDVLSLVSYIEATGELPGNFSYIASCILEKMKRVSDLNKDSGLRIQSGVSMAAVTRLIDRISDLKQLYECIPDSLNKIVNGETQVNQTTNTMAVG